MTLDLSEKLDFNNVLIKPKRSTLESRSQVNLERTFKPKYGKEFSGIGIISANMASGTFKMLDSLSKYKCFTAIAKHNNDQWVPLEKALNIEEVIKRINWGFYTIGMNDDELIKLQTFNNICKVRIGFEVAESIKIHVDITNGYTQKFASFIAKVRETFPNNLIVAGNVATPEMVQELIINGADYVKIGIGPGSQCTTRLKTGVGYPQISASIECSDAAHGLGAGIILDGGMRSPGDIAKAFCANSDMVMLGGMLSGTDECDGDIITKYFKSDELEWIDGNYKQKIIEKKYKLFYGMSSDYAEEIEYKGSVEYIIQDILGGLRSCGTYIGASTIKDFGKCATLVKVPRVHDRF